MPRAMTSRSNKNVRHRFFCQRRIVDTRDAWSRYATTSLHSDHTFAASLGHRSKSLVVRRHYKIGGVRSQDAAHPRCRERSGASVTRETIPAPSARQSPPLRSTDRRIHAEQPHRRHRTLRPTAHGPACAGILLRPARRPHLVRLMAIPSAHCASRESREARR